MRDAASDVCLPTWPGNPLNAAKRKRGKNGNVQRVTKMKPENMADASCKVVTWYNTHSSKQNLQTGSGPDTLRSWLRRQGVWSTVLNSSSVNK